MSDLTPELRDEIAQRLRESITVQAVPSQTKKPGKPRRGGHLRGYRGLTPR
jgi:hypothetical protein